MEELSLTALLDEDREMVLSNLARDAALPAAQETLEKAVDRLMYRYTEACDDPVLRQSAQHILQAVKNTLPMISAVGEARTWNRQAEPTKRKGLSLGLMGTSLLAAGLVLVVAAVLGILIAGRLTGPLALLKALLPAGLGCGALFWAGIQAARPGQARLDPPPPEALRTEFLADGEQAWHCLRGAVLQADGQLERIREGRLIEQQQRAQAAPGGKVETDALELFAELLESAYASGDESARESISAIRFYLHNAGVDVADYAPQRESWFEFLPAPCAGTIRPALVSGDRLLKKGLAARG